MIVPVLADFTPSVAQFTAAENAGQVTTSVEHCTHKTVRTTSQSSLFVQSVAVMYMEVRVVQCCKAQKLCTLDMIVQETWHVVYVSAALQYLHQKVEHPL